MSELPPDPPPEPTALPDEGWQRLDPRMLLVHPIRTLWGFMVPILIGFFGFRASDGNMPLWAIPMILIAPIVIGVVTWWRTEYRLTSTQFQQRKGLLSRQQLTAPLDRVRSVDLEASLLYRVLGLTKVKVGTGVEGGDIELDSLSVAQAEELRSVLLRRRGSVSTPLDRTGDEFDHPEDGLDRPAKADPPAEVLARIDWSWLRFAPFSLTRLVVLGGIVGLYFQFNDRVPVLDQNAVDGAWGRVSAIALPLLIAGIFLAALLGWLLISIGGYVVQWANLVLQREGDSIRLTSGLFTTRSITVEEARIRGVRLKEPPLLRLVKGAELSTYSTGLAGGVTDVLPPSPRHVNEAVGHAILDERHGEDNAYAMTVPVVSHGPRAHRRCHIREQWFTLFLAAVAVVSYATGWPGWMPTWALIAIPLAQLTLGLIGAELEYRGLGHALTPEHLVSRHGAYQRTREVLERDGIIGWEIKQNYFQRRVGLATLVATTAAGPDHVEIVDIPLDAAVRVAHRVTPAALQPFTVTSPASA